MKQAVILRPDDFQAFISELKEVVKSEIRGYVVEEPLTVKQAAAYLKVTEGTLWKRIDRGAIPTSVVHRSGGGVYFFASELEAYLKNN